jgi:hypothetical protein
MISSCWQVDEIEFMESVVVDGWREIKFSGRASRKGLPKFGIQSRLLGNYARYPEAERC